MNLEQLLKLDNISDYYILWYGAECVDTYFDKSGFCKDTVELTRCKPIGDNTIYLFMSGINRKHAIINVLPNCILQRKRQFILWNA